MGIGTLLRCGQALLAKRRRSSPRSHQRVSEVLPTVRLIADRSIDCTRSHPTSQPARGNGTGPVFLDQFFLTGGERGRIARPLLRRNGS